MEPPALAKQQVREPGTLCNRQRGVPFLHLALLACLLMAHLGASGCVRPRPVHIRWPWTKTDSDHAGDRQPPQGASATTSTPRVELQPIVPASATDDETDTEVLSTVVARVNGEPILAEDLLAPLRDRLAQARASLTEPEFIALRDQLLKDQLDALIERQLIVQEARRRLPEAAQRRLEAIADEEFEKQLKAEAKRLNLPGVEALRRQLESSGQSLERMKQLNRDTFIAQQFVRSQIADRIKVTRREMLEWYNAHRAEFESTPRARWREILVSVRRHGSRQAALAHARRLVEQLREGADFAELARSESDGATAPKGGEWPWTPPGSYVVDAVDKALFSLPVGKVSDPIEGPEGYHIVLVEERREGGIRPFEEVQDEIEQHLRQEKTQRELKKLVDRLRQRAYIVSVLD